MGATVMRTVTGLIEATAISTGIPATRIGADWPRMTTGLKAAAAPAAARFFRARRRETGLDIAKS
jgi:hypothetical protein